MTALHVLALTTDRAHEPSWLDTDSPQLAWLARSDERDQRQSACHIVVASSPELLAEGRADVWDSGVVSTSDPWLRYAGPPLRSRTRYWWKVRAFDRDGSPSGWSETSWWETGLAVDDWRASWIGRRPRPELCPVRQLGREWARVLLPGHTLGQTFTTTGPLTAVAVDLGSDLAEAHCTLTVRVDGPDGRTLERRRVYVRDGEYFSQWVGFADPHPAGRYHVEISEVAGLVHWYGETGKRDGWLAYEDGQPVDGLRALSAEAPADASPLLRKDFRLDGDTDSARLYISGLGYYEVYLNGRRVGDQVLDPAPTDYRKRVLYACHDVTDLLLPGANVLEAALGRGFYALRTANVWGWNSAPWHGEPRLLCQLEATLESGDAVQILSDGTWQATAGPTLDSLYGGERYEAKAPDWEPADVLAPPGGRLATQDIPPMRATEPVVLTARETLPDRSRRYDVGQVMAGWARLEAEGPPGTEVVLRYSEQPDGVDNDHVAGATQTDTYVLSGEGRQSWEPRFSYKGFRYVHVSASQALSFERVSARSVWSSVVSASEFQCSDSVLSWIDQATGRTILGNLHGVPTDTPVYEKNGWMDDHLIAETAIHHFDMRRFYRKRLRDCADAQAHDGSLPVVVPTPGWGRIGDPCWSSYPLLAWTLYEYYGDADVLDEHFESLSRYTERFFGGRWMGFTYGDWLPPGHMFAPEGGQLAATAFCYRLADRMASIAGALDRPSEAERFAGAAVLIAKEFNEAFLDRGTATYGTGKGGYRQTSNVLPLAFGMVPADIQQDVAAHLVRYVRAKGHLDTGSIGTKHLLPVLAEHGHIDLAVTLATRTDPPSWGHWRALGATTLREGWDDDARSHNHYFFGTASQWLREHVAGLRPATPGFEHITVRPLRDDRVDSANLRYRSVRGDITVSWRHSGPSYTLDLTVPVGVSATVHIPVRPGDEVIESGEAVPGTTTVGSGTHHFRAEPPHGS